MAKLDQANSVIGEGSIFEGKFYIAGSLKVDGKFEGEIKTEETLMIGETGKIKTDIKAQEVVLAGTLLGDIYAGQEVVLTDTGKMLGNITSPVLTLSKGTVVKGSINITGGAKKDVKKMVEESFGSTKELDKKGV